MKNTAGATTTNARSKNAALEASIVGRSNEGFLRFHRTQTAKVVTTAAINPGKLETAEPRTQDNDPRHLAGSLVGSAPQVWTAWTAPVSALATTAGSAGLHSATCWRTPAPGMPLARLATCAHAWTKASCLPRYGVAMPAV